MKTVTNILIQWRVVGRKGGVRFGDGSGGGEEFITIAAVGQAIRGRQ